MHETCVESQAVAFLGVLAGTRSLKARPGSDILVAFRYAFNQAKSTRVPGPSHAGILKTPLISMSGSLGIVPMSHVWPLLPSPGQECHGRAKPFVGEMEEIHQKGCKDTHALALTHRSSNSLFCCCSSSCSSPY